MKKYCMILVVAIVFVSPNVLGREIVLIKENLLCKSSLIEERVCIGDCDDNKEQFFVKISFEYDKKNISNYECVEAKNLSLTTWIADANTGDRKNIEEYNSNSYGTEIVGANVMYSQGGTSHIFYVTKIVTGKFNRKSIGFNLLKRYSSRFIDSGSYYYIYDLSGGGYQMAPPSNLECIQAG